MKRQDALELLGSRRPTKSHLFPKSAPSTYVGHKPCKSANIEAPALCPRLLQGDRGSQAFPVSAQLLSPLKRFI